MLQRQNKASLQDKKPHPSRNMRPSFKSSNSTKGRLRGGSQFPRQSTSYRAQLRAVKIVSAVKPPKCMQAHICRLHKLKQIYRHPQLNLEILTLETFPLILLNFRRVVKLPEVFLPFYPNERRPEHAILLTGPSRRPQSQSVREFSAKQSLRLSTAKTLHSGNLPNVRPPAPRVKKEKLVHWLFSRGTRSHSL